MKNLFQLLVALLLLSLIFGLSSCGEKHGEGEGHDHKVEAVGDLHEHEAETSSYQEGKGINLSRETEQALGVELAEVKERTVGSTIPLAAQIYRSAAEASRTHGSERQGKAYATALVSRELTTQLKAGQKLTFRAKDATTATGEGLVWKIDTTQMAILGKAEALLELSDPLATLAVGDFVEATVPVGEVGRKVTCIPRSAVLETAMGKYAFVQNGSFLLRTEIKTGAQDRDYIEVTEGLYDGDVIAVKPVEALYLIELRATKGGGHSH